MSHHRSHETSLRAAQPQNETPDRTAGPHRPRWSLRIAGAAAVTAALVGVVAGGIPASGDTTDPARRPVAYTGGGGHPTSPWSSQEPGGTVPTRTEPTRTHPNRTHPNRTARPARVASNSRTSS